MLFLTTLLLLKAFLFLTTFRISQLCCLGQLSFLTTFTLKMQKAGADWGQTCRLRRTKWRLRTRHVSHERESGNFAVFNNFYLKNAKGRTTLRASPLLLDCRSLPTETQVENGTSQSKSSTSRNLSYGEDLSSSSYEIGASNAARRFVSCPPHQHPSAGDLMAPRTDSTTRIRSRLLQTMQ